MSATGADEQGQGEEETDYDVPSHDIRPGLAP